MKYKIYRTHHMSDKKDLILETEDLQDILKFYDGNNDNGIFGYEIRLIDFDKAFEEFKELIEGNYSFDVSFEEYINNELQMDIALTALEELVQGKRIIVQGALWNCGERKGYIVGNNNENIAEAIKWISKDLFEDYVMEIESEE